MTCASQSLRWIQDHQRATGLLGSCDRSIERFLYTSRPVLKAPFQQKGIRSELITDGCHEVGRRRMARFEIRSAELVAPFALHDAVFADRLRNRVCPLFGGKAALMTWFSTGNRR